MAKLKSASCSTGHDSGITPPVSVRLMLERERVRLSIKRGLRTFGRSKIRAEQEEARQAYLGSREYRKALAFLGIREAA